MISKLFIESVTSLQFVISTVEYSICLSHCNSADNCLQEAFEDLTNFELDCLLYDI